MEAILDFNMAASQSLASVLQLLYMYISYESRYGGVKTVRRIISNRDVKLPDNWKGFVGLDANKANLASFLSEELLKDGCFDGKQVIVSGGFQFSDKVASNVSCDLSHLSANHKETDTRIVLHAADATRYERMIVCCRDTDVLLLLCVFSNYLSNEVWVKAGTKKMMMMKLPILPCAEKLES